MHTDTNTSKQVQCLHLVFTKPLFSKLGQTYSWGKDISEATPQKNSTDPEFL